MKVGSLVECIDGQWISEDSTLLKMRRTDGPATKEICTVAGFCKRYGTTYIKLEEYPCPDPLNPSDDSFPIEYFREVQPPMNVEEEISIEKPQLAQV